MNLFEEIQADIRNFAAKRDWEKFHSPKNLAMAISGESGELAAEFQWLTELESSIDGLDSSRYQAIKLEIADVAIYLFRIADVLKIDLESAIREKIKINENRFTIN